MKKLNRQETTKYKTIFKFFLLIRGKKKYENKRINS